MRKKIAFIFGSPREQGNTKALMNAAVDAAREAGAEVDIFDATKIEHKHPGCIACLGCQQFEDFHCIIDDEVAKNVEKLPLYDTIVIASPLFWWSFPAQLKIFLDRMYSLVKFTDRGVFSSIKGKTLALMACAGGPVENNLEVMEKQLLCAASMCEMEFRSCLFPLAPHEAGAISKDERAMQKAAYFGTCLAEK